MARLKSIAIGPGSGSAGDVTYRTVRGRTIMSRRVTESTSDTPSQRNRRDAFAIMQRFYKFYRDWVELYFEKTKYGSPVNAVSHYNYSYLYDLIQGGVVTMVGLAKKMFDKTSSALTDARKYLSKGSLRVMYTQRAFTGFTDTNTLGIVLDEDTLNGVDNPAITLSAYRVYGSAASVVIDTAEVTLKLSVLSMDAVKVMTAAQKDALAVDGYAAAYVGEDGHLVVVLPYRSSGTGHTFSANPEVEAFWTLWLDGDDDAGIIHDEYNAVGWLYENTEGHVGFNGLRLGNKVATFMV